MERRSQKDPGENICAAGGCSALVKREGHREPQHKEAVSGLGLTVGECRDARWGVHA